MKPQSFSIKRCIDLFKYDWALEKSRFLMGIGIILGIWIAVSGLYFLLSYMAHGGFDALNMSPMTLSASLSSVFKIAIIGMGIYITTILHQKFTYPMSSTQYLILPSLPVEKTVVMLFEYFVSCTLVWLLFYLCAFLSLSVGALLAPGIDWYEPLTLTMTKIDELSNGGIINFDNLDSEMAPYADQFRSLVEEGFQLLKNVIYFFSYVLSFISLLIYICLNMCFRRNPQPKSIFLMIFGYIVLCIVAAVGIFSFFIDLDPDNMETAALLSLLQNALTWAKIIVYSLPVWLLLLCYLFYRQVRYRMAK